jgi:hypothetical protein
VVHGEQGSAKSFTASVLRKLIDPNRANLRGEPKEARDLAIWGHNGWVICMDNLSHIQPWLSDALCRMATGGGFSTRSLFTDDEEQIFEAQRPVMMTAIEECATRADLLDRAVMITLPRLTSCVPEEKLWADFEKALPAILGALLDAAACAIRTLPDVQLDSLPRMADFASWATAAESGLGLQNGAFLTAYAGNRDEANTLAIEASPIGKYVLQLAEDVADDPDGFCGTPTELVARLDVIAGHSDKIRPPRGWPTNRSIRGALTRIAPNLRQAGVEVEFEKTEKARLVSIRRKSVIIVSDVSDSKSTAEMQGAADDPCDPLTIPDENLPSEILLNDEHDDPDDVCSFSSETVEEVRTWTF